jgi:LytS/YehU family sensor histidine kinase
MHRDVDRADTLLMKLAGLLRHVVDRGHETQVTLRDELEFLDRYLALEQMRFGERIRVRRELDPAALGARVPNLLLQPIVENAIKHGLEPLPDGGTITLRANRTEDGQLCLEVRDDGCGLPTTGIVGGGVGTANVRSRIRQLYGREGSVEFAPPTDGSRGLWVTLRLPWQTTTK